MLNYFHLQAFDWLDSNQDGKIQVEELQTHVAFDQNQDGTVSVEEAKFFLHNEEEMERNEFITTGWPLVKPFLLKAQELDKQQAQMDQAGEQSDHHEEQAPEVSKNSFTFS